MDGQEMPIKSIVQKKRQRLITCLQKKVVEMYQRMNFVYLSKFIQDKNKPVEGVLPESDMEAITLAEQELSCLKK